MKKVLSILLLFTVPVLNLAQKTWNDAQITGKDIKAHIYYLASDEMKGRFTGTDEERLAAEYIKDQFQKSGLKPLLNGSYFQDFPFIEKIELTGSNKLNLEIKGENKSLQLRTDFITAPFSGKAELSSGLVFAGYGISAPRLNYDDYEGLDVKGKVVLAMRYHPEHDSAKSEFDRYSSYRQKASAARDKGAAGIIFFNGLLPRNDEDQLMELRYDGAGSIQDFAVIQVKRNIIEEILKAEGQDLATLQKKIDDSRKPKSFALNSTKASLATNVREVQSTGRNVIGIIEGSDPQLKNEYIVMGAHYDHLGIDHLKTSSMYKGNEPQIHNGADDNASGTTGLMELAEKFGADKNDLKRSLIFIAFSGEELGLLGSSYFTNNSPVQISSISAMLNMDMIGRLSDDKALTVIGAGTSSIWKNVLNDKNRYNFKLALSDGGSGGSDHQAFTNKNIPVLFFFTGTHNDYHKPTDDADKINYTGQEEVVNYVYEIANTIQGRADRPDFVKVEEPAQRSVPRSRVTVGTVPEFGYNGNGYKVSGVTEGGPAAKAGMQSGDIIVKFGSKTVNNIYDFMYAMGEFSPGDKVDVIVLREGKEVKLNLELTTK